MKVLNFGSMNIDKVYSVKDFVRKGETISATEYNEYPGGKGLNQSIAMAKAGLRVFHAGKVGEDGLWLSELLAENKVSIKHMFITDKKTGHAIIQVTETGENSIIIEGGANRAFSSRNIDKVFLDFEKDDYLA